MGPRGIAMAGWVGIAAGVTGALSVIPMLAWPAQSPVGLVRYPFTLEQFHVIQTWFFVHHLGLVTVLVGLASSGASGAGKVARGAAWVAVVGTTMLALMELVAALRFGDWESKVAGEGAMGAGYGVSTNLIGIGLVIAGIGVARARVWTGWARFIPLTLGLMHFVVVTPCLFSGNFVAGRLGIGSWMVVFGALGLALVRYSDAARVTSRHREMVDPVRTG
jgi:hypothetical protein